METLNIAKETKERFIAYMGILQHCYKRTITQDEAVTELLDKAWKHFKEDYKIEPSMCVVVEKEKVKP